MKSIIIRYHNRECAFEYDCIFVEKKMEIFTFHTKDYNLKKVMGENFQISVTEKGTDNFHYRNSSESDYGKIEREIIALLKSEIFGQDK